MKRVYITVQKPRSIYLSFLYVDSLPTERESGLMDKLSGITDLFFIFPEKVAKKIYPRKFTTQYNGFGYMITDTPSAPESILYGMDYFRSLYPGDYTWLMITSMSRLTTTRKPLFQQIQGKILELTVSNSVCPSIQRLPFETSCAIYVRSGKQSWWRWGREDMTDMYWTHQVTGEGPIFLRPRMIDELVSETEPEWLRTFSQRTWEDFFASWVEYHSKWDELLNIKNLIHEI